MNLTAETAIYLTNSLTEARKMTGRMKEGLPPVESHRRRTTKDNTGALKEEVSVNALEKTTSIARLSNDPAI